MPRSKNEYDEDIFKDSTMTFGQHLEDLRRCLFRAILGLLGGVAIGLLFGDRVVQVIKAPLEKALTNFYERESEDRLAKWDQDAKAEDQEPLATPKQYDSLIKNDRLLNQEMYVNPREMMAQLQQFFPKAFADVDVTALPEDAEISKKNMMRILLWHRVEDDTRIQARSLSAHETFMIFLKASLLVGALLAAPWIFWHLWSFVAAGLYPHERRYVNIYLPFSVLLFFTGALVAYFFVFGPVLKFLFGFNRWLGITPDLRISEWLGFVLMLPLGFGVAFQLPLVMLFLERIGIMTVRMYLSYWRVAILVIFVIAAFCTPPDPWSMSLLAFPLTLLYFGGILLCKYMPRGRSLLPVD